MGGHLHGHNHSICRLSGGSAKNRIQIVSYTSESERAELKEVFCREGPDKGVALLRTMSKGYTNIAGQSGRKKLAAVTLDVPKGERLILKDGFFDLATQSPEIAILTDIVGANRVS